MLDVATLRVVFAVVAMALFTLFLGTFRRTRSSYSGWWCAALLNFISGSLLFLCNGSVHQTWANPLGNTILVLGCACVWAAARSLRARRARIGWLLTAPAITGVASVLDQREDTWSGGLVFLAMMGVMIALASVELWTSREESRERRTLALSAGLFAAYYAVRCFVFGWQGPQSALFQTYLGSATTTIMTLLLLVVVSFSMTSLSNDQLIAGLRHVAARDGLTDLLNRRAFLETAQRELDKLRLTSSPAALIMADLDRFKAVNDHHGHPAGDQVLRAFAAACSQTIRRGDVVGRYGGEEFIILLPGASENDATAVITRINTCLAQSHEHTNLNPTASYGVAMKARIQGPEDLTAMIQAADKALYTAKALGRNHTVAASQV